MKIWHLLVVLGALLIAPACLANGIPPNTTTPLGPGYHLDTTPVTGFSPRLIDPCWFIGITGSSLPAVQSLDLANSTRPVLNSNLTEPPEPEAPQDFKLFLGQINPPSGTPQFAFDLPTGVPSMNRDGTYDFDWTATTIGEPDGPTFAGLFHLDVGDGSVTKWSVQILPQSAGGPSSFEIDFTVTPNARAVGDPALTFGLDETLSGQTTALNFVAAPEPGTFALLSSAMVVLVSLRKRL